MFVIYSDQGEIPQSWRHYQRRESGDDGRAYEVDPEKAVDGVDKTRGVHARFEFLRKIYVAEIQRP